MKILITGDSLGLPRPYDVRDFDFESEKELAVSFNDTYGYILHKELQNKIPHKSIYVINRCQRSSTIKEVREQLFDHLCYFQADILIMQVGICDCIPREELQGRQKVNLEEFINNFMEIFLCVKKKSNVKLIIIGISPVAERMEQKFPGLISEIKKYNKIFKSAVDNEQIFYVDMERYIDIAKPYTYLHGDGYHINKNGNLLIFNECMSIIENILKRASKETPEVLLFGDEVLNTEDRLILDNLLYMFLINKRYNDILLYKEIDLPIVSYYVGRAYKFLNKYEDAIIYLKKFIEKAEKTQFFHKAFTKDGKQLIISAYFHLGEIYYIQLDKENAKIYLEECRNISQYRHSAAESLLNDMELN